MLLYVMRHGAAEDRAGSGRDADRALTNQGRERVVRVATELRRIRGGAPAPRVLASPLRRAVETAEIVAEVVAGGSVIEGPANAGSRPTLIDVHEALAMDADPPLSLAIELAKLGTDTLVVGHLPNVEQLVRALAAPVSLQGSFCTALVVALEPVPSVARAPGDGALRRFHVRYMVDPRLLP